MKHVYNILNSKCCEKYFIPTRVLSLKNLKNIIPGALIYRTMGYISKIDVYAYFTTKCNFKIRHKQEKINKKLMDLPQVFPITQ